MTITNVVKKRDVSAEEAALVEAARSDVSAFDVLYRRYATRVYRYCYTHTSNAADAEDLTAQTFLAALEGIGRFRGRGSFASWLFGIAWRKCKDHHRQRLRNPQTTLHQAERMANPDAPNPEHRAYKSAVLDCIEQSLSQLSEDRQEVLRLRFWAGLNTAETATIMDRSRGAVKMLLSRAVSDLRERCLDE